MNEVAIINYNEKFLTILRIIYMVHKVCSRSAKKN